MSEGEPLIRWDWIAGHLDEIGQRLVQHVELTAIAVGVGTVIAFGLALLIIQLGISRTLIRHKWMAGRNAFFRGLHNFQFAEQHLTKSHFSRTLLVPNVTALPREIREVG